MQSSQMLNQFSFEHHCFSRFSRRSNHGGILMNYITYILHGQCRIEAKGKTLYAMEEDVFFVPKDLPYDILWEGDSEDGKIEFLSFGFFHLHSTEPFDYGLQLINCPDSLKERIMSIPTATQQITCKTLSLFYDVVADLLPCMVRPENKDAQVVEKAREYIYAHYNCTISDVAEHCYVSEPYLYKIFNRHLHTSPNRFKGKILCEKGIELLTTTDKTIEEISAILGLSSGSYFRKILLRYTNKTPKEIRKAGFLRQK